MQRVRKYLTLMSCRIPALILAAVAYGIWHNGLISLAILVVVDSAAVDGRARSPTTARRGEPRNPGATSAARVHRCSRPPNGRRSKHGDPRAPPQPDRDELPTAMFPAETLLALF